MQLEEKKDLPYRQIRYVLGRKPYLFFEVIYFIYALFTLIFTELFEGENYGVLPFSLIGDYYGFLLVCLLLGITLLFISYKYFHVRLNYLFLVGLSILFIGNTIALLYFRSIYAIDFFGQNYFYKLTDIRRYQYIFMYMNTCLFLYVTFACLPKCKINASYLLFSKYIVIIVAYFAIIYSYFYNSDIYYNFFNSITEPNSQFVTSFLGDKNVFGMVCLLAMFIELKMMYETKNNWHIISLVYLYVHIIISQCRSATIAGIILFFGYYVLIAFEQFKLSHKKTAYIMFSIIGFAFLMVILILCVPALSKIALFDRFASTIKNNLGENSSLSSRKDIWNKFFILANSNPMYFIFGLGTMNFNNAFIYACDNHGARFWHLHNGFLEPFGEGGLIRFIINILFLFYLFYLTIKSYIKTKEMKPFLYLVLLISFCSRIIFEPEYLLSSSMLSILSLIIVAVPIISYSCNLNIEFKAIKEPLIIDKKIPKWRLLYILPVSLISIGYLLDISLLYRIVIIIVGCLLQFFGYFMLMKKDTPINKDDRKFHEFLFIIIVDCVVFLEAFICDFAFKKGVCTYMYAIFFDYVFTLALYYFFLEYSLLDDELSFIKENEVRYERRYLKSCTVIKERINNRQNKSKKDANVEGEISE